MMLDDEPEWIADELIRVQYEPPRTWKEATD